LSNRIGWQDLRSTSAQRGRVLVVAEAGARTCRMKPVSAESLHLAMHDDVAARRVLVERNVLAGGS
jgi:hypothetical protein